MTATTKGQGGKGNNDKATLAPFVGFSDRGYIHYRPRIVQYALVRNIGHIRKNGMCNTLHTLCIDATAQCTIADTAHN